MDIDAFLFAFILLGIDLFLFVIFGFLLHSAEFFLFSLGYELPLFIFPFQHLDFTIFLSIRLFDLHDLLAPVSLPLPMFLCLFPHLFHHINSLLFTPCDLPLQLLDPLFLVRRLSTHLLLLLVLLLSQAFLVLQVLQLLLVELFKLSALLGVTRSAQLLRTFLLESEHFLLDG